MAYQYDPFDPEEMRRRQLMDMGDGSSNPGLSSVMADDPGDQEEALSDSGGATTPKAASPTTSSAQLSPAQQKYKDALGQMPNRADYKPSGWRRFGAALAGGLAGMRDPAAGVKIASTIVNQPYDQANNEWQANVNRSALEMGVDKEASAQDIARQRAGSYAESARARTAAAASLDADRKFKEAHAKWEPQTEDQATRLEQSKRAPTKPSEFELYQSNPAEYAKYQAAKAKQPGLTLADHMALQNNRNASAERMNNARIAARKQGVQKPVYASPTDQARAQQIAIDQLLTSNPAYEKFVNRGDGTPKNPHVVKTPDEVNSIGTGLFGIQGALHIGSGSATQQQLNKLKYADFLSDLKKKRKEILSTQKSGGDGGIDLQEHDPDDEPDLDPDDLEGR